MASLAEYFDKVTYKGIYDIGDRVTGRWNSIPFMGTIGNDTQLNPIDGPYCTVHLDLPIKVDDTVKNVIVVKHADIRRLI